MSKRKPDYIVKDMMLTRGVGGGNIKKYLINCSRCSVELVRDARPKNATCVDCKEKRRKELYKKNYKKLK